MNDQSDAWADAPAHPLNAIAEQFKAPDTERHQSDAVASSPPSLSLLKLSSPALLIDQSLNVVWQNSLACSMLWQVQDQKINPSHAPSIFDLLFSSAFQRRVDPWKQWLAFFVDTVRHVTTPSDLEGVIEELAEERQLLVKGMITDLEDTSHPTRRRSGLYGSLIDGHGTAFDVAVTRFESNVLMVFEPRSADDPQLVEAEDSGVKIRSEMPHQQPQPVKIDLCVLSAVLNDAKTIRTEMLDEEYGRLFLRIWHLCAETIEDFGGEVSQSGGTGILGYFLSSGRNPSSPLGAIQCALELKRKILEVGREWKIRKGWLHDIDLNMGIHTGIEQMVTLPSSLGDQLLTLGATLDVARYLSGISSGGQIWATKAVIHCVPENDLKSLRFGIFRTDNQRQVFIARYFSRIRDLAPAKGSGSNPESDLGACAVTQIFDRQGHG